MLNQQKKLNRRSYKKAGNPFYGKKHTKKSNEKNRKAHLGKKYSDEVNKKKGSNPPWNKGKKHSSETIEKLRKISKKLGLRPPSRKGVRRTRKEIEKFRKSMKLRFDIKGRKTNERILIMCSEKYQDWRMKVFVRDNFTCQVCKKVGGELQAHHIKGWKDYPKLRFNVDNGITLCKKCHYLTDNYGGRKK